MRAAIILIKIAAQRYFPLASPKAARRQTIKLMKAKKWMHERKIDAMRNREFKYVPATGSVL